MYSLTAFSNTNVVYFYWKKKDLGFQEICQVFVIIVDSDLVGRTFKELVSMLKRTYDLQKLLIMNLAIDLDLSFRPYLIYFLKFRQPLKDYSSNTSYGPYTNEQNWW